MRNRVASLLAAFARCSFVCLLACLRSVRINDIDNDDDDKCPSWLPSTHERNVVQTDENSLGHDLPRPCFVTETTVSRGSNFKQSISQQSFVSFLLRYLHSEILLKSRFAYFLTPFLLFSRLNHFIYIFFKYIKLIHHAWSQNGSSSF